MAAEGFEKWLGQCLRAVPIPSGAGVAKVGAPAAVIRLGVFTDEGEEDPAPWRPGGRQVCGGRTWGRNGAIPG